MALALSLLVDGLLLGSAPRVATRVPAVRADLASFEKSFMDNLYIEERLDKNKALYDLKEALPSLLGLVKADAPTLRQGIDEAREAGAGVAELKPYVEALQKADASLVTETDLAILKGAEQVVAASGPVIAKPPPDSYLTMEQFEALKEASMCAEDCWDSSKGPVPDDLRTVWGNAQMFFSLLRNPNREVPEPMVWEVVRERWPNLAGVPDDELQKNLTECRKEYCDASNL